MQLPRHPGPLGVHRGPLIQLGQPRHLLGPGPLGLRLIPVLSYDHAGDDRGDPDQAELDDGHGQDAQVTGDESRGRSADDGEDRGDAEHPLAQPARAVQDGGVDDCR